MMGGLAGGPGGMMALYGGMRDKMEEIQNQILLMAQVFPAGAQEFSEARMLLMMGLKKGLVESGTPPGGSNVGSQFPGGGFGSGLP